VNWIYRFGFRFSNDNNTRSNTGIVFVVAVTVIYWLTCTGKSSGPVDLVLMNRDLWRASELCNSCSSSWSLIPALWCGLTGWIAKWGWPFAIGYWIFARRDEVGRIWEGTVERFLLDQGGTQDLPDQPITQTLGTPAPTLASQGRQQGGRFWWLRSGFLSALVSDLIAGLLFHRF
jgi:hypothetical protein